MKRTRSHQPYRSDLEWEARTKLPINHCAEMLTQVSNSAPKSKSIFIFFQEVHHF
ncbi:hypothetical protein ACEE39_04850 [Streptococcus suis]